jgi:hypothetical protein
MPGLRDASKDQLRAWSTGLDLAAGTFGMGLIGYLIDRWQGTAPWWMLGLGLAGLVGGAYRFVREALRVNREQAARFQRRYRAGPVTPNDARPTETDPEVRDERRAQGANTDPDDSPGP